MKRLIVWASIAAILTGAGSAHAGSYGTELPFVLGTSARASGLGVSGVSLLGDASSQYYNPAVLTELQWKEFVFYRSTLFESSSMYHTLSYAQPLLTNGTLAVTFMRVDAGDIEERDASNQLLSSDLHSSQTRVLVGYGRQLAGTISAGFNVVFDNQSFAEYSGSGFGLDIGVSASQALGGKSMIRGLRQGLVIRNLIEPAVKLDRERVADPMQLALGFSVISEIQQVAMVTSVDLVNPKFSPAALHFGQELTYHRNYSLRFGVDETTPTYGFGARYRNLSLDYAFRSEDIGDNHRISLAVRFGSSLNERVAANRLVTEREINSRISKRMDEMEEEQIARSLSTGRSLLSEAHYDDALKYFEATLLWDPNNEEAKALSLECRFEATVKRGRTLMAANDFAAALVYLREALRHKPGDTKTTALITECNSHIMSTRDSAAAVNTMLKTAIDLYADRRFSEAKSGFEGVLSISPTNPLASEYRDKCVANIRSVVSAHKKRATNLAAAGEYERAISELRATLAYENTPAVRNQIARYGRLMAETETPDTLRIQPSEQPQQSPAQPAQKLAGLDKRYGMGIEYFDNGDFTAAIKALSEVWAVDAKFRNVSPLLAKAYLFVGMNYYAEQNYGQAIMMWEKALTVDPKNSKAERYLRKASEEARALGGLSGQ